MTGTRAHGCRHVQAVNRRPEAAHALRPFAKPQALGAAEAATLATLARFTRHAFVNAHACAFAREAADPMVGVPTNLGALDAQRKAQYLMKDGLGVQVRYCEPRRAGRAAQGLSLIHISEPTRPY